MAAPGCCGHCPPGKDGACAPSQDSPAAAGGAEGRRCRRRDPLPMVDGFQQRSFEDLDLLHAQGEEGEEEADEQDESVGLQGGYAQYTRGLQQRMRDPSRVAAAVQAEAQRRALHTARGLQLHRHLASPTAAAPAATAGECARRCEQRRVSRGESPRAVDAVVAPRAPHTAPCARPRTPRRYLLRTPTSPHAQHCLRRLTPPPAPPTRGSGGRGGRSPSSDSTDFVFDEADAAQDDGRIPDELRRHLGMKAEDGGGLLDVYLSAGATATSHACVEACGTGVLADGADAEGLTSLCFLGQQAHLLPPDSFAGLLFSDISSDEANECDALCSSGRAVGGAGSTPGGGGGRRQPRSAGGRPGETRAPR